MKHIFSFEKEEKSKIPSLQLKLVPEASHPSSRRPSNPRAGSSRQQTFLKHVSHPTKPAPAKLHNTGFTVHIPRVQSQSPAVATPANAVIDKFLPCFPRIKNAKGNQCYMLQELRAVIG